PLRDEFPGSAPVTHDPGEYPYAPFDRAWQTAMKNLTLNELLIAAIAIKRYELRHGQAPANLVSLEREFVAKTPRDLMDGQTLRYRTSANGGFLLYSVGDDAKDDGADGSFATSANERAKTPWTAR